MFEAWRDFELHKAWRSWKRMRAALDELAGEGPEVEASEARLWGAQEAAEATIAETAAQTPSGAAIRLRIALGTILTDREQEAVLWRGDLDEFKGMELDGVQKLLISLLRDLETMGDAHGE